MLVCSSFSGLENEYLQWFVLWSCQYGDPIFWPRSYCLDIHAQSTLVLAGAGYGSPLAPGGHLYDYIYRWLAGNSARTVRSLPGGWRETRLANLPLHYLSFAT